MASSTRGGDIGKTDFLADRVVLAEIVGSASQIIKLRCRDESDSACDGDNESGEAEPRRPRRRVLAPTLVADRGAGKGERPDEQRPAVADP